MSWFEIATTSVLLGVLYFGKNYFRGAKCKLTADLTKKIIVITGGSSGLGYESAIELANSGGTVILACRSEEKTIPLIQAIKEGSGNQNIEFMRLDLSDLSSVRKFAEDFAKKYDRLDILINNAGLASQSRQETANGFETTIGINYLAHYYLTNLLIPVLLKSGQAKVINLSSMFYKYGKINFDDFNYEKKFTPTAYMDSKLAMILFAQELSKRFEENGIKGVSLHPGVVRTEANRFYLGKQRTAIFLSKLFYPLFWYLSKSPIEGIQTINYCALEDYDKLVAGGYYTDCKLTKPDLEMVQDDTSEKLWNFSRHLIESKGFSLTL